MRALRDRRHEAARRQLGKAPPPCMNHRRRLGTDSTRWRNMCRCWANGISEPLLSRITARCFIACLPSAAPRLVRTLSVALRVRQC